MRILHSLAHYSYSAFELRKCVHPEDAWSYGLTTVSADTEAERISTEFYASGYGVQNISRQTLRGKNIFPAATLYDKLCLRRTDELLRHALCTTLIHRDHEIQQLLVTLRGEGKTNVMRADISSFFEKVDFGAVITQLEQDGFRNTAALKHLRAVNSYLLNKYGYSGLPRGIGLSSTLADYLLRGLDHAMQTHGGVYYYARYVDDICIVHNLDGASLEKKLIDVLPVGLSLNSRKTAHLVVGVAGELEFLGYSIDALDAKKVKIAEKKLAKTKQRIALSLRQFTLDRDIGLLRDRLRFLMCSTEMRMLRRERPILCGFRNTYRHCSEAEILIQLQQLDSFYFCLLKSKRCSLSKKVRALAGGPHWIELVQVSFVSAYKKKITHFVDQLRIAEINKAWAYG